MNSSESFHLNKDAISYDQISDPTKNISTSASKATGACSKMSKANVRASTDCVRSRASTVFKPEHEEHQINGVPHHTLPLFGRLELEAGAGVVWEKNTVAWLVARGWCWSGVRGKYYRAGGWYTSRTLWLSPLTKADAVSLSHWVRPLVVVPWDKVVCRIFLFHIYC